jgi:hypothetical protein
VIALLLATDSDAVWDAQLLPLLSAAEEGGARGVLVHCIGYVPDTAAAAAEEERLQAALVRAEKARVAAVARLAAEKEAAAAAAAADAQTTILVSAAASAAATADSEGLKSTLVHLELRPLPSAGNARTLFLARTAQLRLLLAAIQLQAGEIDPAASALVRSSALATLPSGNKPYPGSSDVVAALRRFDSAFVDASSGAQLRRAAADAAAAERSCAPLAERLDALPLWEELVSGVSPCADADALRASIASVRAAEALSERLSRATSAAALRSALNEADAAPPAVGGALAAELSAARPRAAKLEALAAVAAAAADGDAQRINAASEAAMTAGATFSEVLAASQPPAATSRRPSDPGEWSAAGESIWFDRSLELGKGSRGTVVYGAW